MGNNHKGYEFNATYFSGGLLRPFRGFLIPYHPVHLQGVAAPFGRESNSQVYVDIAEEQSLFHTDTVMRLIRYTKGLTDQGEKIYDHTEFFELRKKTQKKADTDSLDGIYQGFWFWSPFVCGLPDDFLQCPTKEESLLELLRTSQIPFLFQDKEVLSRFRSAKRDPYPDSSQVF